MLNVTVENIRELAVVELQKKAAVRWGVMSSCACQWSQAPDTALPKPAKTNE